MKNQKLKAITVSTAHTIRETMHVINRAASQGAPVGIALVLDAGGHLEGIITDGDIRRALVDGRTLDSRAADIMVKNPITVSPGLSAEQMIEEMTEKVRRSAHIRDTKVEFLVVLDERRRVVDVVHTFELLTRINTTNWTVGVIGLGFVGLTLAVSLAEMGFRVHGIDIDEPTVESIRAGDPHFHEVGLEPLLKHHLSRGRFKVHAAQPTGVDVHIVAVGTPIGADGRPQLQSVQKAAESIAAHLKPGNLVLLRSTVPVGTTRNVVKPILEEGSGLRCGEDFFLAFAPERTVEGNALKELRTLPQIVGGYDPRSREITAQFFSKLAPNIVQVESLEAAEMVKLINNSFRDLSFAFSNELAIISDHWNLDAVKIIEAANMGYPRNPIPLPSPGVGGFCLTKDPIIYAWAGREKGYEPKLPVDGRYINELIVRRVGEKVVSFFKRHQRPARGAKVFIIGFAFKGQPETSDIRHSTTLDLLPDLQKAGFRLYGYDPVVPADHIAALNVEAVSLEEGFAEADVVLLMNNHRSYTDLDLYDLLPRMNRPALFFDGWHLFERVEVEQIEGITYEGLSGTF